MRARASIGGALADPLIAQKVLEVLAWLLVLLVVVGVGAEVGESLMAVALPVISVPYKLMPTSTEPTVDIRTMQIPGLDSVSPFQAQIMKTFAATAFLRALPDSTHVKDELTTGDVVAFVNIVRSMQELGHDRAEIFDVFAQFIQEWYSPLEAMREAYTSELQRLMESVWPIASRGYIGLVQIGESFYQQVTPSVECTLKITTPPGLNTR